MSADAEEKNFLQSCGSLTMEACHGSGHTDIHRMIYRIVFVGNTGKHNRPGPCSMISADKETRVGKVLRELCRAIDASSKTDRDFSIDPTSNFSG